VSGLIEGVAWPLDRVGDAVVAVARAARFPPSDVVLPAFPLGAIGEHAVLERWVDGVARAVNLEAEPIRVTYPDIEPMIRRGSASVLTVAVDPATNGGRAFAVVAFVGARAGSARVVAPDGVTRAVPIVDLVREMRARIAPALQRRVDTLLERTGIAPSRRAQAREALLEEQLAANLLDAGWRLSMPPSARFVDQLARAGLLRQVIAMTSVQLVNQVLSLVGWWVIGKGALEGHLSTGWLVAWLLVLTTLVPLGVLASSQQGELAVSFATLLKRRLLYGALRLEPEETRSEGAGSLLGRVIESEALEQLVTSGGLASLLAVVELLVAGTVLAEGPAGLLGPALLAGWALIGIVVGFRFFQRLRAWTKARLVMTHDLVERMVGHRTRLAQEPRAAWHVAEDEQLAKYAERSQAMDAFSARMQSIFPRGWLVLGMLTLGTSFVASNAPSALAVGLGGVILGYRAIGRLAGGVNALLGAQVAWEQTAPLFDAAGREEHSGRAALAAATAHVDRPGVLLEARDLSFTYGERPEPVFRGVSVRIAPRDRLLLEGPSGGGKSTFGSILTGIRRPTSGLLLLAGLDLHTLGPHGWRHRIAAAPQFHENHVLSTTLAFNLLMGRAWPPREDDLVEAQRVCTELGLGPLLERMPSGLMQIVGESGWQLSHGERSRLFIARALLQRADMIVLDESFAALDPETLELAMRCVLHRAPTLLVIAHP